MRTGKLLKMKFLNMHSWQIRLYGGMKMRKIRFVKVAVPEIVSHIISGNDFENTEKDYRCPICGLGIAEEYLCCPYCMTEFNWSKVKQPKSEEFRKLIDSI